MTDTRRCLLVPYVTMPPDPETVVTRTPLSETTYYETTMTPDEAEGFGFALQLDARRARQAAAANARVKRGLG